MSVIYYNGNRLALSTIEPQDESKLRAWINDPEIWSTLGMRRPINGPQEAKIIEQFNTSNEDLIFGIYLKAEEKIIFIVLKESKPGSTNKNIPAPIIIKVTVFNTLFVLNVCNTAILIYFGDTNIQFICHLKQV